MVVCGQEEGLSLNGNETVTIYDHVTVPPSQRSH